MDQHYSSFMNASMQWSKKVSGPGTLQGSFPFSHGESKAIGHGTRPLLTLCYHHWLNLSLHYGLYRGSCLTHCQAAAKGNGRMRQELEAKMWTMSVDWGCRAKHWETFWEGWGSSGHVFSGIWPQDINSTSLRKLIILLMWVIFGSDIFLLILCLSARFCCIFCSPTIILWNFFPVAKQVHHLFFSQQLLFVTLAVPVLLVGHWNEPDQQTDLS